jgi:hypothetical protein
LTVVVAAWVAARPRGKDLPCDLSGKIARQGGQNPDRRPSRDAVGARTGSIGRYIRVRGALCRKSAGSRTRRRAFGSRMSEPTKPIDVSRVRVDEFRYRPLGGLAASANRGPFWSTTSRSRANGGKSRWQIRRLGRSRLFLEGDSSRSQSRTTAGCSPTCRRGRGWRSSRHGTIAISSR